MISFFQHLSYIIALPAFVRYLLDIYVVRVLHWNDKQTCQIVRRDGIYSPFFKCLVSLHACEAWSCWNSISCRAIIERKVYWWVAHDMREFFDRLVVSVTPKYNFLSLGSLAMPHSIKLISNYNELCDAELLLWISKEA